MIGGTSDREHRREERQEQQEHQLHAAQLQTAGEDTDTPRVLEYLSEVDDVADLRDDSLDQLTSKLASTANLDDETVAGKEWVGELQALLWKCRFPPEYGARGAFRAWMYDDLDEYRDPLSPGDVVEKEGYLHNYTLALTRSKDFKGPEMATKDTKESIVRGKDKKGGGGILGRLK